MNEFISYLGDMKYYCILLQIFLLIAGIKNIWAATDDERNFEKDYARLGLRTNSLSSCSTNSDTAFLECTFPYKRRSTSFSDYSVGSDTMYSTDVIYVNRETLTQYGFNNESADCFLTIRGAWINFEIDEPLKKTEKLRKHAVKFLNTTEFFPEGYAIELRYSLVLALQVLLQKRYTLLNYCMKIARGQTVVTSEFFLDFSDQYSITQQFPKSLANLLGKDTANKMPAVLKNHLSSSLAWVSIVAAFSSYPDKGRCCIIL